MRHENILRSMRGIKIFLSPYSSNGSGKIELKRLFVVDNLVHTVIRFNSRVCMVFQWKGGFTMT